MAIADFFLDGTARALFLLGTKGRRGLATFLGWLAFDVLRARRKVVMGNLQIAFGNKMSERELVEIGRASTTHFFLIMIEFFCSKWLYPTLTVHARNEEHPKKAAAGGRGAYIMSVHMGNFELMCATSTHRWAPSYAVTKRTKKGAVLKWVSKRRTENGEFEIEGGRGERQTKIFEALDGNGFIGFMVDQHRYKGMPLPLFGKTALTNTGLFYLWRERKAPIVPCFIHRFSDTEHEIVFYPEFEVEDRPEWSEEEFYAHNGKTMNALVEEMISLYPKEYFWMHKRWK